MKKKKIIEENIATGSTLVLHEPPKDEWSSMQRLLDIRTNKQEILSYANAIIPWLANYSYIERVKVDGKAEKAVECIIMMEPNAMKWEITRGVALIVCDKQNMQAYINSMDTKIKTLWRMILTNIYVSMETAKQVLGVTQKLYKEERNYYYYDSYQWNNRWCGWFSIVNCYGGIADKWGYRESEMFITVSSFVRSLFYPHFFPETEDGDLSLAELPEGEWRTISLENDSVGNFNLFQSMFQHGEFPLKKKGIGLTDIKRAQKKLTFTEFFPDDNSEYRKNLRSRYYMQLLGVNGHCQPTGKGKQKKVVTLRSYQDTLRDLITNFSRFNFCITSMLFPHIKGLRKQMVDYGRETKLAEKMFSWLRQEPQRWIGINDLLLKIGAIENGNSTSRYDTLVFCPDDEHYSVTIQNEYSGRIITAEFYTQEFGYTALQALALMLCSVGIAEVALSDDTHRNLSPFDTVDYMRLTPLGQYALNVTDNYEPPEQEHVAYFELDPERLIIRSLQDPNPYAQLLLDTSVAISRNRFETSALSFLASCHKREDVETKINMFRQFISDKLPPLWEQFFQQLLQHCHPLKEDRTSYKRYTLDPQNRDLIQLITTDPDIRQIVIRAEGYRFMVKNDDLKIFEKQLKKHGYLL